MKRVKIVIVLLSIMIIFTACSKKGESSDLDAGMTIKEIPTISEVPIGIDEPHQEINPGADIASDTSTSIPDSTTSIPTEILEPTFEPVKINGQVGDIIILGSYEQDNDLSNGEEPIEWIVLSNDGEKLLLLSKYALDSKPYNINKEDTTWEKCSLRNWLNNDFYSTAFNSSEKAVIRNSSIENPNNQFYETAGGNGTEDHIFLLAYNDVINPGYGFNNNHEEFDMARRCIPTAYAISQGALTSEIHKDREWFSDRYLSAEGNYTCCWWLRTPGGLARNTIRVDYDGYVFIDGHGVDFDRITVRPALYVDVN